MSRLGTWDRKLWEDFSGIYNRTRQAVRVVHDVESPFGEFLTVERTPIIELNSSYGFSAIRDLKEELNGGTVSSSDAEFIIQTGTTPNGYARLDSAEIGRYVPGYSAELGLGIRVPNTPTGNIVARWGGYGQTEENGFYFGIDATGYFVARLKDGVETKVYQSNWNVDKMDGTGVSTFDINNSDGHIFQIVFSWYGYGAVEFGVIGTVDGVQRFITCHVLSDFDETSIDSPNLRLFAEVDNGGDAVNFPIYVGGRQYSIVGKYVPKFRFTGNFRTSAATTTTVRPLISFRRKTTFGNRSVKLQGYDAIAASQPHVIEIRLGGTLTGGTFGTPTNHTAAETAVESNIGATAITGGIVIWQQLINSGQGAQTILSQQAVDVDIPNGETVTLCARSVSGTGSVTSAFRLREEW